MAVFKFVIGTGTGKTYQIEKDQGDAKALIGMKIGREFEGGILGLDGYKLRITGGTDRDGFPMEMSVEGTAKKKMLSKKGMCFSGKKKVKKKTVKISGIRRKKMVRGNAVDSNTVQINCRIVAEGQKPIDEILGKKDSAQEKTEEAKKE